MPASMAAVDPLATRDGANAVRFVPGIAHGHYESFFHRANHPTRRLALWIRYTVFCPRDRPQEAVGERWAIYFDGETGRIVAAKDVVPMAQCAFVSIASGLRVGDATLTDDALSGHASGPDGTLRWDLRVLHRDGGGERPLWLLPRNLYDGGFPKAKSLVPAPHTSYTGELTVGDTTVPIDGWVGSQNHNWGLRHTDHYAWGQVAGFDDHPDAFLELSTARVRIGPFWTPFMTLVVLRLGDEQFDLNGLGRALRAKGRFEYFTWEFATRSAAVRLSGRIHAPREAFVALRYDNPPGGHKTCLNSKLAACELTLERDGQPTLHLRTEHRAAFEILTDDDSHGLAHRL